MATVKSTDGRKGKRIVLGRNESSTERPITTSFQMSISEAFKLFVSVKEAENVKPRTKAEYHVQFGYFQEWLNANYSNLLHVQEISPTILRSYINYLAYEKIRYEGVDHRSTMMCVDCLRTLLISVYDSLKHGLTFWLRSRRLLRIQ